MVGGGIGHVYSVIVILIWAFLFRLSLLTLLGKPSDWLVGAPDVEDPNVLNKIENIWGIKVSWCDWRQTDDMTRLHMYVIPCAPIKWIKDSWWCITCLISHLYLLFFHNVCTYYPKGCSHGIFYLPLSGKGQAKVGWELGFTSVRKKTEILDRSPKTINILQVFFEPKWNSCWKVSTHLKMGGSFEPL